MIEAAVRTGYTIKACTEKACTWNNDFLKKIEPAPITAIKFYSKDAISKKKEKIKGPKSKHSFHAGKHPSGSTLEEQNLFLSSLASLPTKAVGLHCFSSYVDKFIPKNDFSNRPRLPNSLRELYDPSHAKKLPTEIEKLAQDVTKTMEVSKEDVAYAFASTKQQSLSIAWHELRTGRITASVAHDVLHTNMTYPSRSLILRICKEPSLKQLNVLSLKWGSEKESVALEELGIFLSSSHKEFQIEKCGLLLCEDFPLIGASPDGTFSCQCHDQRLLIEIKCPYTLRETSSLQEALSIDPKFF